MKKTSIKTKEERQREINFIRKTPGKIRKHKKLINGRMAKEDLVNLLAALWKNLEKITFKPRKLKDGEIVFDEYKKLKARKYKNIPAFNHFNKYPRKILVGMYGSTLQQ
ncbi:hypothetical protein KAR91_16790 [Candidatus Pacearchaeota archaeon]|nr:hypothetical protein [Candidatus Pacearchaeota archaeon]